MTATIRNLQDLKTALRAGPYAWPGGYPVYFVAADCEPLSYDAVKGNIREVFGAVMHPGTAQDWQVVGVDINWEADLHCAHTGKRIESAYAEPEGEI